MPSSTANAHEHTQPPGQTQLEQKPYQYLGLTWIVLDNHPLLNTHTHTNIYLAHVDIQTQTFTHTHTHDTHAHINTHTTTDMHTTSVQSRISLAHPVSE